MKKVPISVVIPVFNGERFIADAIKSVRAQTLSVDEIIVVDNNSTDNSLAVAKELGVKVLQQKKQGTPAARNMGIRESRNDWIALLDQDDLWEEEKIKFQWKAIEAFPAARMIGSDVLIVFLDTGRETHAIKEDKLTSKIETLKIPGAEISYIRSANQKLFNWFYHQTSGVIFHREVTSTVGFFNEEIVFCDELDFFMRIAARFPIAKVDKDLVQFRRHDRNHSLEIALVEKIDRNLVMLMELASNNPEKYPAGAGYYYQKLIKDMFINIGWSLANPPEVSKH